LREIKPTKSPYIELARGRTPTPYHRAEAWPRRRRDPRQGVLSEDATIATPEGLQAPHVGDWIAEGLNGELYPMRAERGRELYEGRAPSERVLDDEDVANARGFGSINLELIRQRVGERGLRGAKRAIAQHHVERLREDSRSHRLR
jgi:hypothetical protein